MDEIEQSFELKVEGEVQPGIRAEITGQSTIVNNYKYFASLAREMVDLASREAEQDDKVLGEYRYSVASVIFSYSYVETYFNHLWHSPNSPIRQIFDGMSRDLRRRLDNAPLAERIAYSIRYYPGAKASTLDRGAEPFLSFDLLRQLRNFLIHYKPRLEVKWSSSPDHKQEITDLERRVTGKFAFNDKAERQAFVYRCYSYDCARWSAEVSEKVVAWLSETLSSEKV